MSLGLLFKNYELFDVHRGARQHTPIWRSLPLPLSFLLSVQNTVIISLTLKLCPQDVWETFADWCRESGLCMLTTWSVFFGDSYSEEWLIKLISIGMFTHFAIFFFFFFKWDCLTSPLEILRLGVTVAFWTHPMTHRLSWIQSLLCHTELCDLWPRLPIPTGAAGDAIPCPRARDSTG